MQLRDYQEAARDSVFHYFAEKAGNPLIAMPTGTGKSLVIAGLLQSMFFQYPMTRVMMLTHVKELIEQNFEKLKAVWPSAPAGIYSSGLGKKESGFPITFAGIGSVAKKASLFQFIDIIIIDEAHLVSPSDATQYRKFVEELRKVNPNIKIVGLTATPYRLGQGHLTEGDNPLFTDVCIDLTTETAFNWFISEGYLSPLIPKRTELLLDASGINMRGGEFVEKEVQLAVDKETITRGAIIEIMKYGIDRNRCLVFASGVEHAIHISDMMNEYGISNVVIHSKMSDSERDENIEKFKSGKVWAAVNNNVLTTGFDLPIIDLIAVIRLTASANLWVQMLGRGTRPVYAPGFALGTREGRLAAIAAGPKHNCLVLDFGANTKRLGPINNPVLPRKKGEKGGEAPVKDCPVCNSYVHASARVCPVCNSEFTFRVKFKSEASTAELISGADLPVMEVYKVESVVLSGHNKPGKPPMVKVEYMCAKRKKFYEHVCPEHVGFPLHKAKQWWRKRSDVAFPADSATILSQGEFLRAPTHIKVHVNKNPLPEIVDECWDGSAFGTQPPVEESQPQVFVDRGKALIRLGSKPTEPVPANAIDLDDDIPF